MKKNNHHKSQLLEHRHEACTVSYNSFKRSVTKIEALRSYNPSTLWSLMGVKELANCTTSNWLSITDLLNHKPTFFLQIQNQHNDDF